ncbi:MAG: LacI family transcriptional regulator [Treponema sp.]|jgi:LacI family transcriptional regulator|nr:LacI family transcriptional regulator [Treponema sp.]
MRVTIKDIAQRIGISPASVSIILNGKKGRFSNTTRKKVIEAARKMNYRPNRLAVGLLTKRTKTIGLIVSDLRNLFFSELASGVGNYLYLKEYSMVLADTNDNFKREMQSVQVMMDHGVDGIAIAMTVQSFGKNGNEIMALLADSGVPVVLTDSFNYTERFSSVVASTRQSSFEAVQYLAAMGHRRIACISAPLGVETLFDRFQGYLDGIAEAGIPVDEDMIAEGNFRYESGYNAMKKLFKFHPTAVFCHNDMMTFGAISAIKDKGLAIPRDISVIGFDNIFFSRFLDTPLSTIEQPAYEMGEKTAEILLDEIENRTIAKRHLMLKSRFVKRESTTAPFKYPG